MPAWAGEENGYAVIKVNHEFLNAAGETHAETANLVSKARYQEALGKSGKAIGIRFVIHWKAPSDHLRNFTIKVEARGYDAGADRETTQTLVKNFPETDTASDWAFLDITDESYKRFGKLMAWKVTLLRDDSPMAARKSFMWDDTIPAAEKEN